MIERKYPQRHNNHTLEEKSITFFRNYLPENWNYNTIDRDYGQDLNIEIAEGNRYKGLEFIVQLKSSATPNILDEYERQSLKVSTYNYLWDNLRVVLIIKFIESENEAYWTLLKDIPEPNQEQDSFTIKIPRVNKLSELDWNLITDYVKAITHKKLEAVRPIK
jgi:hypothetical protein